MLTAAEVRQEIHQAYEDGLTEGLERGRLEAKAAHGAYLFRTEPERLQGILQMVAYCPRACCREK